MQKKEFKRDKGKGMKKQPEEKEESRKTERI